MPVLTRGSFRITRGSFRARPDLTGRRGPLHGALDTFNGRVDVLIVDVPVGAEAHDVLVERDAEHALVFAVVEETLYSDAGYGLVRTSSYNTGSGGSENHPISANPLFCCEQM